MNKLNKLRITKRHRTRKGGLGVAARREAATHHYVWYLAKRLVLQEGRLLMFSFHQLDCDDLIRDVALPGNQSHAARAGGHGGSVKFE